MARKTLNSSVCLILLLLITGCSGSGVSNYKNLPGKYQLFEHGELKDFSVMRVKETAYAGYYVIGVGDMASAFTSVLIDEKPPDKFTEAVELYRKTPPYRMCSGSLYSLNLYSVALAAAQPLEGGHLFIISNDPLVLAVGKSKTFGYTSNSNAVSLIGPHDLESAICLIRPQDLDKPVEKLIILDTWPTASPHDKNGPSSTLLEKMIAPRVRQTALPAEYTISKVLKNPSFWQPPITKALNAH